MNRLKMLVAVFVMATASNPALAATILYENGTLNGTVDANTINSGLSVTNSFTLNTTSTITGAVFGGWTQAGTTIQSVSYGFSPAPSFATQETTSLLASTVLKLAYDFYDVRTYEFSVTPLTLSAGTYWLTLAGAAADGQPAYWDQNFGPSTAFQSGAGEITSNYFQILGDPVVSAAPEPATWLSMILGFGVVGGALRTARKRKPIASRA